MSRPMKNSGVEWIGEIPEGWDVVKLKTQGTFYSAGVDKKIRENEDLYKSVHYTDVYYNSIGKIKNSDNYLVISATKEKAEKSNLIKGDVLFTTSSETPEDIGHSTVVEEDLINTLMGYHLIRFRASIPYVLEFEKYQFGSNHMRRWFAFRANGMTRYGLRGVDFLEAPYIKIPIPEQQKIADFLDEKTTKINDIIANTKQSIIELKKYKQALVTETVTKGLNPDVKMMDSGIKWIGEIPKHWRCTKIRNLCYLQSGKNLTSEEIEPEGLFPVYGGNGIRGYYHTFNRDGYHILIGRQGALCGNINLARGKFWATEHAIVVDNKGFTDVTYFSYLLQSMNLNQYSQTAAQPGLAVGQINNLKTILPPIKEQQEIADFLDEKCAHIDSLSADKEKLISEFEDYKKALIYEYVTGKKEVE